MDRNLLKDNLDRCKYLELSFVPNVPEDEKKYVLITYEWIKTVTGLLIVFEIEDIAAQQKITFCIPDISHVQLHPNPQGNSSRYAIRCVVRPAYFQLKELGEMKRKGMTASEEMEVDLLGNSEMVYRILLHLE